MIDIKICADCAQWVANLDDSGVDNDDTGNEYRQRRDEGLEALGYVVVNMDEDYGFTRNGCDICGQTGHHGIDATVF
jgi:hypothetical protein